MMKSAGLCLMIAITSALFGFSGFAGAAVGLTKIIFVVFLVFAMALFVLGKRRVT
ncbi:MAG: DUF1328 domain-containing protein [Cyanobacteria bacterium]|nr:DUF1328 domain-containing protein [Cyanobacteria bacterium bin.51]